jgi:hypothetical protein
MFDAKELQFILQSAENTRSQDTDAGRLKANVILKCCDELERLKAEEDEKAKQKKK